MGFGRMQEGVGGPKFRPPVGAGHHEGGPDPILVWVWGCPRPQSLGKARTWGGGEGFVLTCFGFCCLGLPDSSLGLWGHRKERGEGFPQLWGGLGEN